MAGKTLYHEVVGNLAKRFAQGTGGHAGAGFEQGNQLFGAAQADQAGDLAQRVRGLQQEMSGAVHTFMENFIFR